MAAEAQTPPIWATEQQGFAAAWVAAWRQIGGTIAAPSNGRKYLWFPLVGAAEREARSARRALLAVLDLAGSDARDAVFAAAAAADAGSAG